MGRPFENEPLMISVETGHYVKGMHNLLNALFDLRHFSKFEVILKNSRIIIIHPWGSIMIISEFIPGYI